MPREKDKERERDVERVWKREQKKERKRGSKKEGKWRPSVRVCLRVCIHISSILPQALQRLHLAYNTSGNESESWRVPSAPLNPPQPILLILLFSLSSFSPHLSSHLHAHETQQLLSSWPAHHIYFHQFCVYVLFRKEQNTERLTQEQKKWDTLVTPYKKWQN